MPKNGNRGPNTTRSNGPFASNNEDIDSNVIFEDAKSKKKAKQGSMVGDSVKKVGNIASAISDDPPKKPDTKKLVSEIQKSLQSLDCCKIACRDVIPKRVLC